MTFGEKLLKLRKEKGMSQEALAEQLNTSRQAVSKWENGQGYPETVKLLMIGNIFDVSIDYLLKEETEYSDNINEQGYYVSREVVDSYIISERKRANLPSIGVFFLIASTIFPNIFIKHESIANAIMLCLMAVGITLLMEFMFQLIFKINKFKELVNEPLVFDYNFLKELKEKYSILIKKYVGMMVFSLFLVFSGIILLNMVNGNWADGVFLFLVAIAVSIMIYAGYMMIIYNGIANSNIRSRKNNN